MKNLYVFGRLFAEPSFTEGVSRLFDLGGTLQEYNDSETEQKADMEEIKSDWCAVGDDLKFSISNYEQKLAEQSK
ncbi:MAG: hypothetical protein AAB736_00885 [Patescibacteria group bacterium]